MPIANEDRERARRWLEMFAPGMSHADRVQWIKANIEDLARSYAEVREEAERAMRGVAKMVEGPDYENALKGWIRQARDAHRAGMEEAARIVDGWTYRQSYRDIAKAIRAAMKEGKGV
jgi:hypothetical protein